MARLENPKAALLSEIQQLKATLDTAVRMAVVLLQNEAKSQHLGHNLGNRATEITEINAKLAQTRMIYQSLYPLE